jgi:hypothetical protein
VDLDMDEEQFRRRTAIITIADRVRRRCSGADTTRAEAATDLARFRGLSDRSRNAVLSYFEDRADPD